MSFRNILLYCPANQKPRRLRGQGTVEIVYCLCSLYSSRAPTSTVQQRVRDLGLWTPCRLLDSCRGSVSYLRRYRGQRAGRVRRQPPTLRPVGNGAYIVSHPAVNHRPISCSISCSQRPRTLIDVCTSSPAVLSSDHLTFASLNIRSLTNKVDDLLELRRDRSIDVLCLTETWHSVSK